MPDDTFPIPPQGTPAGASPAADENIVPNPGRPLLPPAAGPDAPAAAPAAPKPGWLASFWRSAPATPTNQPPVDSTREVVETVVFVIVLVLLLKSFVAEAFVIPTGSMAETLWGYQKVVLCPECDTLFPVNAASEADPTDGPPVRVMSCTCPNCRKRIQLVASIEGLSPTKIAAEGLVADPGPTSGDRVLVAKFLYDLWAANPHRLDVVVFKYPGHSGKGGELQFPFSGPYKGHTPMNYIKRLIGIGGETIAICNGKIYILPADKSPQYNDLKNAKTSEEREQLASMMWQQDPYMHISDPKALALFQEGKFQILRKAPENILAMMRLVYDNDHPARDLKNDPEYRRWQGAREAWSEDDANGFLAKPAGGEKEIAWLRYHNRNRDHKEDRDISPFMGYNSDNGRELREELSDWVGDLVLECEVTVDQPQGDFVMELSKGPDRFQAQWNLADGYCTLYRDTTVRDGGMEGDAVKTTRKELDSKKTVLTRGTHRLRFANVDQRLVVWVDDKLVFEDGVSYDVPKPPQKGPNDLQPASIGVKGAKVHVKHVKLFHDTYYSIQTKGVGNPAVLTMYVQPDHFLCMGDNSFHSSDSRSWGLVPRRLMLGKALTVYYPFYFPWWPLSSQVNRIGLIH